METNKLSSSSMLDVCFSGWFGVIGFVILYKPVLIFLFSISFKIFFIHIGQLTLISQFVWVLLCIYVYCIFVNLSTSCKVVLLSALSTCFSPCWEIICGVMFQFLLQYPQDAVLSLPLLKSCLPWLSLFLSESSVWSLRGWYPFCMCILV